MSGTEITPAPELEGNLESTSLIYRRDEHLERIRKVLEGDIPTDSMAAVTAALERQDTDPVPGERIAFCLDANVILKVHNLTDVVDYLGSRHQGLLVMPSQAIQEFWNNKSATQSVAEKVKTHYTNLAKVVDALDPEYQSFKDQFEEALTSFSHSAGHLWAPDFRERVLGAFSTLAARAVEPKFSKSILAVAATERQATKTPPGFKDDGNGDLYVWAEFLLALLEGRDAGHDFDLAVLVTEDKKSDWGKGGEAHPVLVAEMHKLLGVRFETWDVAALTAFAARETS